jgi:hypothetical protein
VSELVARIGIPALNGEYYKYVHYCSKCKVIYYSMERNTLCPRCNGEVD